MSDLERYIHGVLLFSKQSYEAISEEARMATWRESTNDLAALEPDRYEQASREVLHRAPVPLHEDPDEQENLQDLLGAVVEANSDLGELIDTTRIIKYDDSNARTRALPGENQDKPTVLLAASDIVSLWGLNKALIYVSEFSSESILKFFSNSLLNWAMSLADKQQPSFVQLNLPHPNYGLMEGLTEFTDHQERFILLHEIAHLAHEQRIAKMRPQHQHLLRSSTAHDPLVQELLADKQAFLWSERAIDKINIRQVKMFVESILLIPIYRRAVNVVIARNKEELEVIDPINARISALAALAMQTYGDLGRSIIVGMRPFTMGIIESAIRIAAADYHRNASEA